MTIEETADALRRRAEVAERERDRALAALSELQDEAEFLCDRLLSGDAGCIEESIHAASGLRALAAKPESLANRARSRVLREAADALIANRDWVGADGAINVLLSMAVAS